MKSFPIVLGVVLALSTPAAFAAEDGRSGPVVFTGEALDASLAALNQHLQLRYAQDDMIAELDATPRAFAEVAMASAETPLDPVATEMGAFGPMISGGSALDRHLVAFNEDREARGDDLFLRIARQESGKLAGFDTIARDLTRPLQDPFDLVRDDVTLDAAMAHLSQGLKDFESREDRLFGAVPVVTGHSFDRYHDALQLLF